MELNYQLMTLLIILDINLLKLLEKDHIVSIVY